MLNIGTPLSDALGGMDVAVVSTGASICGRVLAASGFDVREEAGFAPAPSVSPVADLIKTQTLKL